MEVLGPERKHIAQVLRDASMELSYVWMPPEKKAQPGYVGIRTKNMRLYERLVDIYHDFLARGTSPITFVTSTLENIEPELNPESKPKNERILNNASVFSESEFVKLDELTAEQKAANRKKKIKTALSNVQRGGAPRIKLREKMGLAPLDGIDLLDAPSRSNLMSSAFKLVPYVVQRWRHPKIVKANQYEGDLNYYVLYPENDVIAYGEDKNGTPMEVSLEAREPLAFAMLYHLQPVQGADPNRAKAFYYLAHFGRSSRMENFNLKTGAEMLQRIKLLAGDEPIFLEIEKQKVNSGLHRYYMEDGGFHDTLDMKANKDPQWVEWMDFITKASEKAWTTTFEEMGVNTISHTRHNIFEKDAFLANNNVWLVYWSKWPKTGPTIWPRPEKSLTPELPALFGGSSVVVANARRSRRGASPEALAEEYNMPHAPVGAEPLIISPAQLFAMPSHMWAEYARKLDTVNPLLDNTERIIKLDRSMANFKRAGYPTLNTLDNVGDHFFCNPPEMVVVPPREMPASNARRALGGSFMPYNSEFRRFVLTSPWEGTLQLGGEGGQPVLAGQPLGFATCSVMWPIESKKAPGLFIINLLGIDRALDRTNLEKPLFEYFLSLLTKQAHQLNMLVILQTQYKYKTNYLSSLEKLGFHFSENYTNKMPQQSHRIGPKNFNFLKEYAEQIKILNPENEEVTLFSQDPTMHNLCAMYWGHESLSNDPGVEFLACPHIPELKSYGWRYLGESAVNALEMDWKGRPVAQAAPAVLLYDGQSRAHGDRGRFISSDRLERDSTLMVDTGAEALENRKRALRISPPNGESVVYKRVKSEEDAKANMKAELEKRRDALQEEIEQKKLLLRALDEELESLDAQSKTPESDKEDSGEEMPETEEDEPPASSSNSSPSWDSLRDLVRSSLGKP